MAGRRLIVIMLAPLLLVGCQKADDQPSPGSVTVSEARALDRAVAMIEDQPPSTAAAQPTASGSR